MTCGAMHEDREGLFFCYNFRALDNSEEILAHAKSRSYFVSEYLVGDPIYGDLHMIQFNPPARAYRKFLQSKYRFLPTTSSITLVYQKE